MTSLINTHIPVLANEVIDNLWQSELGSRIYMDGTFGGGGYSKLLNEISENQAQITACDLDATTFENLLVNEVSSNNSANSIGIKFVNSNFCELITTFEDNSMAGIMLDLGFNSNQLITSNRGFSYLETEDVLDLRYDINQGIPLWQKFTKLRDDTILRNIIYEYSGEEMSARVARSIFNKISSGSPIYKVQDLVVVILEAIPAKFQKKQYSILSRIWQSLRIWTNNEFESLEEFLRIAPTKLVSGGRIAIVCFHSLEDKIVTKTMRNLAKPITIDEFGNTTANYKFLTPKAIKPTDKEIEANPRSRSATLRIIERI